MKAPQEQEVGWSGECLLGSSGAYLIKYAKSFPTLRLRSGAWSPDSKGSWFLSHKKRVQHRDRSQAEMQEASGGKGQEDLAEKSSRMWGKG